MSPTSSSKPFAGRKTRSAALRTKSLLFPLRSRRLGGEDYATAYRLKRLNRRRYLRKRARIITSTRRPRSRLRPIITPSSLEAERCGERPRGAVVGRRGDLDPLQLERLERPVDEQPHRLARRRRARARRGRASSRSRRACGATRTCAASRGPGTARLVSSVTASPRNSPRARRPRLAGDEAAHPVLGRVLLGADHDAQLGVLAERRGERPGVAGAQTPQRDAVALEAFRHAAGSAPAREPNRAVIRSRG